VEARLVGDADWRMSSSSGRVRATTALALLALLAIVPTAQASWPGREGTVAFVGAHFFEDGPEPLGTGIWTRRLGGNPLRRLTADPGDRAPAFSPDGRWIVFSRATAPPDRRRVYPRRAIFLMRSDGSALRQLTDGAAEDLDPSFTADGRRVLFARSPAGGTRGDDIHSVALTGGGLRRLTSGPATDARPVASPNGRVVAFDRTWGSRTRIFTMRPSGARVRNATRGLPGTDDAYGPEFHPSGRRLAYARVHDDRPQLFISRPDGSRARLLIAPYRCTGCPIHRSAAFSPEGRALLAVAARPFRYFFVLVRLRNPRAPRALDARFPGRQDSIEPAWQALPRR
jgi:Tol biopolymer transport system component